MEGVNIHVPIPSRLWGGRCDPLRVHIGCSRSECRPRKRIYCRCGRGTRRTGQCSRLPLGCDRRNPCGRAVGCGGDEGNSRFFRRCRQCRHPVRRQVCPSAIALSTAGGERSGAGLGELSVSVCRPSLKSGQHNPSSVSASRQRTIIVCLQAPGEWTCPTSRAWT